MRGISFPYFLDEGFMTPLSQVRVKVSFKVSCVTSQVRIRIYPLLLSVSFVSYFTSTVYSIKNSKKKDNSPNKKKQTKSLNSTVSLV